MCHYRCTKIGSRSADPQEIDGGWRDERNVPGDYQGNDGIPTSCGQSGEDYGAGCRGNIGKSI